MSRIKETFNHGMLLTKSKDPARMQQVQYKLQSYWHGSLTSQLKFICSPKLSIQIQIGANKTRQQNKNPMVVKDAACV